MLDKTANTRITKLSPLLINQLAAGEVVTRPSAVVKEMLENAIDAGATNIEVHITQGGMGMIKVVDNGVGIHPDDMVMAITRHATSKVADIANLQGITTLGFRGEALAATAAVARLTLTSSHDDSGIGRQLQVAGVSADEAKLIPIVHNRGTTVTVKDLYFNVPARRGNLKSIATEFNHIETIVREVALARADVTLSLFHDGKRRLLLSTSSSENLALKNNNKRLPLSRLEQALGSPLSDNAVEIRVDLSSLLQQSAMSATAGVNENIAKQITDKQATIGGWLWPMHDDQQALPKLLYVNGRLVKELIISNQLRQLATSAQLNGLGYALYFELPSNWLNINVHPTKQRIKISPLNNIMAHLSHTIALKLKSVSIPKELATTHVERISDNEKPLRDMLPKDELFEYLPTKTSSLRQQVQAPKQPYQLSATQPPSRKISAYSTKKTAEHQQLDAFNLAVSSLPQCLAVVNNLPDSDKAVSDKAVASARSADANLPVLPWLLFHAQGQYLLINSQVWQQGLQDIADNQVSVQSLISGSMLDCELFVSDNGTASAASIDKQLAIVRGQLSAQDLEKFTLAFTKMLSMKAFKTITTEQLITLMLSY
ncbi:DNA mismatch repair endonuclease MutL [Psychrobacter frigidicola]|uniref:DNA mismatch repair endonuclease MutL n=1 Tax=Psychrobacter frigidicola TaxID=45611 RepID=UPI00191B5BD0|nr:DNA mismatch repair endonuclease MutL [Psychrobacter frigidicola]